VRFLLDENAEHRIGRFLRSLGHDVTAIAINYERGQNDREVLERALAEQRILVTNDRDFWDLAVTQRRPHAGIIIFRLGKVANVHDKLDRLENLLLFDADNLDAVVLLLPDEVHVQRARDFDSPR
jgi:predicted nuclease of predicted toxin-antitoxin system